MVVLIRMKNKIDIANDLNEMQLEAVTSIEGPLLILAGAGSGKTRVITYRIAYMLSEGIKQSSILALTFTNKAAREMQERIKDLCKQKLTMLTISTFHAFGVQILRSEIEALGYKKNFSIYDETDKMAAIKESLIECKMAGDAANLRDIASLFSNIKIGMERWGGANEALQSVYEEYNERLKIYNAVDFDDLLLLPLHIFQNFPEVLNEYRKRYTYIMVDEFQDTSALQYDLLKILSNENVCVVGDDDQSIYSWRGANYENFRNFEDDFPTRKEIKLEQNYRSTTTILEAANGVIQNNSNRKDKVLWSGDKTGRPIELLFPKNESEEADFIAKKIIELRSVGLENSEGVLLSHLRFEDFGILVRNNSLIERIEESLLAENIPYRVSGGTSFFARSEIKDVLSYLRLIANTNDDVNLLRIINTPRRGIGKKTISEITDLARKNKTPLWDAMQKFRNASDVLFEETADDNINDFMTLLETQREAMLGKTGLSKKVNALVDTIDYWSYLITEHSKSEKLAHWKFQNIQSLIESIENWENYPDTLDASLYAYLNRISLLTRDDSSDDDCGKVNLMTIHASKGLEFPVVFIAGAEEGILPSERSIEDNPQNIEEERRLFYVALTRARNKIFITSCLTRKRRSELIKSAPSPFLAEIPRHLIEERDVGEADNIEVSAEEFSAMIKDKFR
ncbi:MAG: UvrD-helicase domain-containing protein [Termitinemataceae bacterium]|nr:MAG: UvrD-helicase domain-containing protein [Termitinemataceae bacterium]